MWEEPDNPFSPWGGPDDPTVRSRPMPAMAICSGWFASPTTIATAGHCVDPKEGRFLLDMQSLKFDPATGAPLPPEPGRPEPKRTVYAFQPREMPGAVITSPTIVRVGDFRPADDGDTARLDVYGMPPARPLAIAPAPPRLGEAVTSIGFPGLNIGSTDGINLKALLSGGKPLAEVLQDSRLQPVNTSGTITSRQYRKGVAVYQVNSDLAQGISGGPTINSRGEVYGVNSQMTLPFIGQNFNVITDTGMLREFLGHDHTHQPDTPASTATQPASKHDNPPDNAVLAGWIILIAVLAAAILGGGITWRHRRSTNRSSTTSPAEKRTTQLPDPSPANPKEAISSQPA